MRKINTGDVFKMARIIKTANIRNQVVEIYSAANRPLSDDDKEDENAKKEIEQRKEKAGIEFVMVLLEGCSEEKMESQLYDLLAGITEKKPEDIENQSLEATISDFKQIVAENNIANFIGAANRLAKNV